MLLDRFTLDDVRRGEGWRRDAAEFHWQYYSALARQRSRIKGSIREGLLEAAEGPFTFEGWQRAVDYERSLEPLSARGSTTAASGGRFNIGDIDDTLFPKFEALYLAAERETALIEKFGATPEDAERHGLSMLELALRRPRSTSVVSIRGKVESVVDLRHPARLSSFVRVTSSLTIAPRLARWAKRLGFDPPTLVSTPRQLVENLMHPDWRLAPELFDVPSTSQVFAQLVLDAGLEGIVYESSKTAKLCVAIFPERLSGSSFIKVEGVAPPGTVVRIGPVAKSPA